MKSILQKVLCVLATISIIVFAVYKLGYYLRPTSTDFCIDAINTFHSMPCDSIEVIGYGSSHEWHAINPEVLYDEYGIGAYNYGCNWQKINTSLLFLEDSFRTQKPKVVLMETGKIDVFKMDENVDGEIYYTKAIDEFDGKFRYLKQALGRNKERFFSYYVPLCAFHDNWISLEESSFYTDLSYSSDYYSTMGYDANDSVIEVNIPSYNPSVQSDLWPESIECLDRMLEVCKDNDAELILFTVPWEGEFAFTDALHEYAAQNGCVYLDLFEHLDEIGLDGKTDFLDGAHVNNNGAEKVSKFLGNYLLQNYDLTDYRTVDNNIWEQNLKR